MTTLPAVVTILDLAVAASATTSMMLEASWTSNGVATTNQVSLSQIMTTGLGTLPAGGATGQLLTKSSGSDFVTQWSNISSLVTVNSTSGLQLSGSTTIALALASVAGLSVLGTNTTGTTIPLPVTASSGAQVLRMNDAGTGFAWGSLNLGSSAAVTGILPLTRGGWGTSTITAFGVVYGNGTSTPGVTAAGTTGWPLIGQGTAAAAVFTTVGVIGGGVGIANYTIGDLLYASATTTLSRLAAVTTGAVLASQGVGAAAAWSTNPVLSGTLRVMSNTAAPSGGTAAFLMSATASLGIYFGTGLPTVIAGTGSIYIRVDGSSSTTRLYSNLNGSTSWTSLVATG